MSGIRWREDLAGWLSFSAPDFNQALLEDHREALSVSLTLSIDDVEEFVSRTTHDIAISGGSVRCEGLGGELEVTTGSLQVFVPASDLVPDLQRMRMRYTIGLRGPEHEQLTLEAFKLVENDPGYDSWTDTTTAFVTIYRDGLDSHDEDRLPLARGIMRVHPLALIRQLSSFRPADGSSRIDAIKGVARFQTFFIGQLGKTYIGRASTRTRPSRPADNGDPAWCTSASSPRWRAVDESASLERAIVDFDVPDLEFPLNLHRLRLAADPDAGRRRGPVLLVPGSGMRAQSFYGQPVGLSIAEYLLREGFDVWIESWRASIDFPRNSYTLDQVAEHDHPAAVTRVLELASGEPRALKAVVHCQGSVSFAMASVAGSLGDTVSHVVSNAVSLFIDVTHRTWIKQRVTLPGVKRMIPGADAQWGLRAETPVAAAMAAVARRLQRPCGNPVCQMANFMYGSGWDVVLRHVDDDGEPWVAPEVHAWAAGELGYTPVSLIEQVAESSRHGHIVPSRGVGEGNPQKYIGRRPATRAKHTFIAGDRNMMFRWQGQKRSADFLAAAGCDARFVALAGYGHLDTFWGRRAANDVFPVVLAGLEDSSSPSQRVANRNGAAVATYGSASSASARTPGTNR